MTKTEQQVDCPLLHEGGDVTFATEILQMNPLIIK